MKKSLTKRYIRHFAAKRPRMAQVTNLMRYLFFSNFKSSLVNIKRFKPVHSGIIITQKCNLKCEFCVYGIPDRDLQSKAEVTMEEFKEMIHHPLFRGSIKFALHGGEPLLHKHFFDFVDISSNLRFFTTTTTNGVLIDAFLKDIVRSPLNSITVSLYDSHLPRQLENLEKLLRERDKARLAVNITRIVNNADFLDMERFIKLGIELRVDGLMFQNTLPYKTKKDVCIFDDNSEYIEFSGALREKYKDRLDVTFPILCSRSDKNRKCRQPMELISVNHRGEISPCCKMVFYSKSKYGNLSNENAWNNSNYRHLRSTLLDNNFDLVGDCECCYFLSNNIYGLR